MDNSEENEVFSIQTFNLTKRFTKKKHKGIFGFLRRERKKERQKNEHSDVTVALDHVNMKIHSGELFGLLGPNGAGKTTLVKCLSTILIPDKGTAVVNGFDIRKQTSMVRASLGLVVGGEEHSTGNSQPETTSCTSLRYTRCRENKPEKELKNS